MIKRMLIGILLLVSALLPVAMSAAPAGAITGYFARGTVSPYGGPHQCIGIETSNDTLWSEPCIPGDGSQQWAAFQVSGVLYMSPVALVGSCLAGKPVDGNKVGLYDCLQHLLVIQGVIITGGHGNKNMIRNLRRQYLSWHGGIGPLTWNARGARINKYKLGQAWTFNGTWQEHKT